MTAIQRAPKPFVAFCLPAIAISVATFTGCQSLMYQPPLPREAQQQRTLASELVPAELQPGPADEVSEPVTAPVREEVFATESSRIELHDRKFGGNPLR